MVNISQMAQNSYNQNQALQQQYNGNVNRYTGEYNQAADTARNAQNTLSDFSKNMQSGTNMYQQGIQQGNQNAGYDVNNLNQAQKQVSQLTSILGNLPRSVQANNANYGATAGNVAGQMATTGQGLSNSLALANQNASNQIQKMQGGLTYGQQYATSGLQGQQNQLTGLTEAAKNATSIMQQAQQTMTNWTQIAQQQGSLTASQQQSYAQAQQAYAAAQQASAQIAYIQSQTTGQNLTNQRAQNDMNSVSYQNQLKYGNPQGQQPTSAPTPNAPDNTPWYDSRQAGFTGISNHDLGTWFGDVAHNFHLFGA